MAQERKMVVLFVLPVGCLGSACSSVWRFGWQFYQVYPASWTCFQAHRHWQILWNLDQTRNQEEMNKVPSQSEEWLKVGSSPACQMGNLIPYEINNADVVLATHATDTSWRDDFSWWWFQRCHSNWVSQPRYRHKPFRGLSWGGRYEGVPPVNNQASSNSVVSQDTDVAVLLLVHSDKMKCPKIWIKR